MNKEKVILQLELEKHKKLCDYYLSKLLRYRRANNKVKNTISNEEITSLENKIEIANIEIKILQTKLEMLDES